MKLQDPVEVVLNDKGREVHCIAFGATVYEALVLMARKEIGALVILAGTKVVGLFSERDYARKVILVGRSSKEVKVSEIMSTDIVTVGPRCTIDECMQHMTKRRFRHIPVVENDKVVGMVSIGDLVNWIMTRQDRAIHDLEDYITGDYPH